ncbi:MAG TPA: hypothetical protein H9839_05550, partial [Candidatus Intestinimonas stercorigallinarum]|nr:hypothetical protein [Candidatus Intestinimonas stercorigallinarum]
YANHLDYVTIHFPAFQHLSHHLLLILPLMNEKAQLMLDFFDRLTAPHGVTKVTPWGAVFLSGALDGRGRRKGRVPGGA